MKLSVLLMVAQMIRHSYHTLLMVGLKFSHSMVKLMFTILVIMIMIVITPTIVISLTQEK